MIKNYEEFIPTGAKLDMENAGMAAGLCAGLVAGKNAGLNACFDLPEGYSPAGEFLCEAAWGLLGGIVGAALGGALGYAIDEVKKNITDSIKQKSQQ